MIGLSLYYSYLYLLLVLYPLLCSTLFSRPFFLGLLSAPEVFGDSSILVHLYLLLGHYLPRFFCRLLVMQIMSLA